MYNKINTLTNNLIDNYMSITDKKTIEKRKFSPSDYLMFRQEAINELENGIVDIDDTDIKRDSVNVNKTFIPSNEVVSNETQTNTSNNAVNNITSSYIKEENIESNDKNLDVNIDNIEDIEDDDNNNLLSILQSVKG